ncbi:MAG: hypothetical protein E7080_09745 [Bacteroidales bacterium]|nr:hypothetical protein [Bacteroidales bacterium]
MAKIITDDATLRTYIPNVLATVDDEVSLFDKLSPHLNMAESWLIENVTGQPVFDKIAIGDRDMRFVNVAMFVVSHAFAMAIPSLDLVLTPNGFGIVSNNNIAPASAERVERLINSLYVIKSQCLTDLLPMLRADVNWHDSEQCKWLAESIIQDLNLISKCGDKNDPYADYDTDRWGVFLALRQKSYDIEQEIANGWISQQLMARLRKCEATATYYDEIRSLISLVKGVICANLRTGVLNRKLLDDAVSYIRSKPKIFPEWYESDTAKLFTPPIFENEKKSGGYFF